MKCCFRDRCKVVEILLIFIKFGMSLGHISCYFGKTDETESSNLSLIQQMCFKDPSTANTDLHKSYSQTEVRNASGENVKFCLVFINRISHAVHSCDYEGICSAEGIHQRLHYEGHENQNGIALCCRQNLCNSPERAKDVTTQFFNSSCYIRSDVSCGGFSCTNRTTFASNGTIIRLEYGCENETVEKEGCHEIPMPGGHIVACVCSGHHCNHPEEIYNSLVAIATVFPLAAMTNPFYPRQQSEHGMTVVATFIGVSALLVFFFILIGIGIRKFREHRAHHLTYTYTQLTAELAEERDTDDEYMLIG